MQPKANIKQRTLGCAVAFISVVLLFTSNTQAGIVAILLSIIATLVIASSRGVSLVWGVAGIIPIVGPLLALFAKPVKSVYGTQTSQVKGEVVKKKNTSLIVVLVLAALIIVPLLVISMLGKH